MYKYHLLFLRNKGCRLSLQNDQSVTFLATQGDILRKNILLENVPYTECTKLEIMDVDHWDPNNAWSAFRFSSLIQVLKTTTGNFQFSVSFQTM